MKLLWSLILGLVAFAVAIPFFERSGERAAREDTTTTPPVEASTSGTLYRWRDRAGVVHIESSPPPSGTPFESFVYSRSAPSRAVPDSPGPAPAHPLTVYTPIGLDELSERVKRTQGLLLEREAALDALEGGL